MLASALLKSDSIPGKILDLLLFGQITPLLNEEILAEYEDVLGRSKFGFESKRVKLLIQSLEEKALFLTRVSSNELFEDEDDVVFFEICLSGRSKMNAFLITGNLRHYPTRSYVVTPRQMLQIIEKDSGE